MRETANGSDVYHPLVVCFEVVVFLIFGKGGEENEKKVRSNYGSIEPARQPLRLCDSDNKQ